MKVIIKFSIILMTPYLCFVYWRNSMKEIGAMRAPVELSWIE